MNRELDLQWVFFIAFKKQLSPFLELFEFMTSDGSLFAIFLRFFIFILVGKFSDVRFTTWVNEHEIKCGWVPDDCARDVSEKSIVFWTFCFDGKSWIFMKKLENFREISFTKALKKPWVKCKIVIWNIKLHV